MSDEADKEAWILVYGRFWPMRVTVIRTQLNAYGLWETLVEKPTGSRVLVEQGHIFKTRNGALGRLQMHLKKAIRRIQCELEGADSDGNDVKGGE